MSSGAVPAGVYKTSRLSSVYFAGHLHWQPAGCSAAQPWPLPVPGHPPCLRKHFELATVTR